MTAWLDGHEGLFSYAPPDAGAIVYVRYHHDINSTTLVHRLRDEKSVLIVPGDHFGMDGYLRIGYGDTQPHLRDGLSRLHDLLREIAA
jgi:aspartate/methionine/tyrosine aminotransferase